MILLGMKTNLNDNLNNNKNNKKPQKDKISTKIERLALKIKSIFPNIDSEAKFNKEKNSKTIPLIEPNEFQIIKQYNLNLNKINNNL